MTLQRHFRLWTFLLIIVPSLLIMAIYTFGQISAAKQQHLDSLQQRVLLQDQLIDYWVTERAADVRKLSQTDTFRMLNSQQMKYTLDFAQQGDYNFDSLSYINKDGVFVMSTLSTGIKFPSAIGKPYYEAALAGKDYVSDVVVGRNSGLPIINFSSPIYDYQGNFQGLILGSIRMSTLETLLQDNWIGHTGEIFLVNREGIMLTEPRHIHTLVEKGIIKGPIKMKFKITDDALRNIRLGESGAATWIDYQGNKVLGAYLDVPNRGWTLIGKINEQEVLAPIYNQLALMAGGTICMLFLILPLAAWLTNRIKQPIDWLIQQSQWVAAEEYQMVAQEKLSRNMLHELLILCDTFVSMSSKIENTINQLKEKDAKLESKIIEIQDMNATLEEEISERQAAEEALRQLNAQLEHKVQERTVAISHYSQELAATNTQLLILNEELRRTSLADGLTGIANRRYFDVFLEREWQRATQEKKPLALLMVDIDFFKAYNDTYGHLAGDDCLKLIAKVLDTTPKRPMDTAARYGGEEFAIVLPDTDEPNAITVAEKIRVGVEKLDIEHAGSSISTHVTVSIGIAVISPAPDTLPVAIITAADSALYQAKREGRNRIKVAEKNLTEQTKFNNNYSI
ncbi:MAG: diguanylate cyclase/phosphodiesterase [Firmicutes bacterium]|nr:diguanylate cyclase/phosphodiesterase [Bacillota bacterium]